MSGATAERVFLVPDIHCDDHDPRAVELAAILHEAFKPTRTIFLGDVIDGEWASTFTKNSWRIAGQLERQLDAWEKVKRKFPSPWSQLLGGNHDFRPDENWAKAQPALRDWKPLSPKQFFRLGDTEFIEEGYVRLAEGEFTVTHGTFTNQRAGWNEMLQWGTSGASAHTHRLFKTYHRSMFHTKVWIESGCLCNNPPSYRRGHAPCAKNWMQGIVALVIEGNRFDPHDVPFTLGYKARLGDKWYSA